jgi:hypothetical protein
MLPRNQISYQYAESRWQIWAKAVNSGTNGAIEHCVVTDGSVCLLIPREGSTFLPSVWAASFTRRHGIAFCLEGLAGHT